MAMNINGISTSIPEEILSKYPYITVVASENTYEASDRNMTTTISIRLVASATELVFVPAAFMNAAYGIPYDTIGSLVNGYAQSSYNKDTGWGDFSEKADEQPLIPIAIMGSPVWTNYDIRKVTGQSSDGSLILGDVYFQNSYTDYSETYEVTAQWLLNLANQARRLHQAEGVVNFTHDEMLTAFEVAPSVSKTNWMEQSTFDYENQIFHSDAEAIYTPPAFSLIQSGVMKVDLPNATEIRVERIVVSNSVNKGWNWRSLFYNCASIKNINAPLLQYTGPQVFHGCTGLESVNLPSLKNLNVMAFRDCTNLVKADFGAITKIGYLAFTGCTKLETLILRAKKVVTYDTDGIGIRDSSCPIMAGTGYIYVPSSYVDSYKTNSKWSAHAAQIRAIEDYPNICGTT